MRLELRLYFLFYLFYVLMLVRLVFEGFLDIGNWIRRVRWIKFMWIIFRENLEWLFIWIIWCFFRERIVIYVCCWVKEIC